MEQRIENLARGIVDMFEDLLEAKSIYIPCANSNDQLRRMIDNPGNFTVLYGAEHKALIDRVGRMLASMTEKPTKGQIGILACNIVDAFEDLLDEKDIDIPCEDRDEQAARLEDDNDAKIYGSEYGGLVARVEGAIITYAARQQPDEVSRKAYLFGLKYSQEEIDRAIAELKRMCSSPYIQKPGRVYGLLESIGQASNLSVAIDALETLMKPKPPITMRQIDILKALQTLGYEWVYKATQYSPTYAKRLREESVTSYSSIAIQVEGLDSLFDTVTFDTTISIRYFLDTCATPDTIDVC